jgi:hypothetical protein
MVATMAVISIMANDMRLAGRLVAGEVEGEQVVDELLVVHGCADLGIARGHQAMHEVVGLLRGASALLQHGGDRCAHGADGVLILWPPGCGSQLGMCVTT